jgi:hypothetical protein
LKTASDIPRPPDLRIAAWCEAHGSGFVGTQPSREAWSLSGLLPGHYVVEVRSGSFFEGFDQSPLMSAEVDLADGGDLVLDLVLRP